MTKPSDPVAVWLHLGALCVWPFALGYTAARLLLNRFATSRR